MAGENDKWEMYADKRGEHRWRRRNVTVWTEIRTD